MELNGAVLSKRWRKVIESGCLYDFDRVIQLVDSETALCMVNKVSTRFKIYEGVRLGEIQAATDGNMDSWFWVGGTSNTADWLTRGRIPSDLGPDSEWWKGPPFLYKPIEEWDIRTWDTRKSVQLPGEKRATTQAAVTSVSPSLIDSTRFSSASKLRWTLARVLSIFRRKSFKEGEASSVTVDDLNKARRYLVVECQKPIDTQCVHQDYSHLNPIKKDSIWVVGNRLVNRNPFSALANEPQVLLPTKHPYARLLMEEAHVKSGHRGRDRTLARFRTKYWVAQGSKVARKAKNDCQLCRLQEAKLLTQEMGQLPVERLKPSPPFTFVMIDFFGPFAVRGEVQRRTTGKAYGILFTDLTSRTVHIEAAFGYDTQSFLLALSRFTSIKGWPSKIFSDPGSQLIGAERQILQVWNEVDKEQLHTVSTENGLEWIFGPADSPWRQGAVEVLVKAAKCCFRLTLENRRLSPSEFSTACYEAANQLNERPLSTTAIDDGPISILTLNLLLMGRSTAMNPGNWIEPSTVQGSMMLVEEVTRLFWQKWTECYAPTLMVQTKWRSQPKRQLARGDVVVVTDSNALRGRYYIAVVEEANPGRDGKVGR